MNQAATPQVKDANGRTPVRPLAADLHPFNVERCYHCHKCTAGCPVVAHMEYGPDRLLRMAALDQRDLVLASRDIWLCAGCFTCATRCPNAINLAAVMDALRQMAVTEGYRAGEPDALLFHRLFIGVVQRLGRSHEALMLGLFKVRSHLPITRDLAAGLALVLRGKVPLLPRDLGATARASAAVRRLAQPRSGAPR
jgi:heterodisulfide reductase subunit C